MWKPTTEEKIATVLILMRYAEDGERFATREELKMLLADPMAYPRYSEAETVRKAARFLKAINKGVVKCK